MISFGWILVARFPFSYVPITSEAFKLLITSVGLMVLAARVACRILQLIFAGNLCPRCRLPGLVIRFASIIGLTFNHLIIPLGMMLAAGLGFCILLLLAGKFNHW